MEYNYTLEESKYIAHALENITVGTRRLLPFHSEKAFIRKLRMPILKFLMLADALSDDYFLQRYITDSIDAAFLVGLTLAQFSSVAWVHKDFNISHAVSKVLVAQVSAAIVRIFSDKAKWKKHIMPGYTPVVSGHRIGYLGLSEVILDYSPRYREIDFRQKQPEKGAGHSFKILAPISLTYDFLVIPEVYPGGCSNNQITQTSDICTNQKDHFQNGYHIVTDNGKEGSELCIKPFEELKQPTAVTEAIRRNEVISTCSLDAMEAINTCFSQWRTVFPSLRSLPKRVYKEKDYREAESWIQATACVYNFIQITPAYIRQLSLLDYLHNAPVSND